jgi:ribosome-associated protein
MEGEVISDLGYLRVDWWIKETPAPSPKQAPDMSAEDNPETTTEPLRLDHFLKTMGMSETGGQAKLTIQNGEVKVNGEVETRRRRKLVPTDVVEVGGKKFVVKSK